MYTDLSQLWRPGVYGQWIMALVGCCCSFTIGQVFSWPGPALPQIRAGNVGFLLSPVEESSMAALAYLGNLISPIPAGSIMDKIGRKNTLQVFSLLTIGSWILLYVGHSAVALYVARALVGVWSGVMYTVLPALIGEVMEPGYRGTTGAIFGVMIFLGALYESLIGMYVSYYVLSLASLVPSVLLFCLFFLVPESPYYYLMKNDRAEAFKSMEWLRGKANNAELDTMEESVRSQLRCRGTFIDIFKVRSYRRAFTITQCLGAIQRLAGLALLMTYSSVTIPDSFITGEQSFTVLNAVWALGSVFSFLIIDKYGRKTLLLISCVGASSSMFAVAAWYYLRDFTEISTSDTNWFPLVGLVGNSVFYAAGIISIPTVVQGELFPVNIKGKASALAVMNMAVFSGISVRLYQPLTQHVGVYMNFVVCAAACAIGAVFACTLLIETRGKSLEEIQDILSEKKSKTKNESVLPS